MSVNSIGFGAEVQSFIQKNKVLCVLTLGIAVIGYSIGKFLGRVVVWLEHCLGIAKKTDEVGRRILNKPIAPQEVLDKNKPLSPQEALHKKSLELFLQNYDETFKEIDKAVADKNVQKLRRLTNEYVNVASSRHVTEVTIEYELYPEFLKSEIDLVKVSTLLKSLLPQIKRLAERDVKEFNDNLPGPRPPSWSSDTVQPNEKVTIMHGGSLSLITKFLCGEAKGYCLANQNGQGLQVHPYFAKTISPKKLAYLWEVCATLSKCYAKRQSAAHADYPACLIGEIEAQYIDAARNSYEGGIRFNYFDKIKNVQIHILTPPMAVAPEIIPLDIRHRLYQLPSVVKIEPPQDDPALKTYDVVFSQLKTKTDASTAYALSNKIYEYLPS